MNANHDLLSFFTNAGLMVQIVMLILLGMSVISWTFIFQKASVLKKMRAELKKFETQFWSGVDMAQFYQTLQQQENAIGLSAIFSAGFKEFLRLRERAADLSSEQVLVNIQRAMMVEQSREVENLEVNLPFLATAGSISPYIGLFGTVWGIMGAFSSLGAVEQAKIAMVAPGISEALIATAMGLFAAIPAVIAYNRYTVAVEKMLTEFDNFQEDFLRVLTPQVQASISK